MNLLHDFVEVERRFLRSTNVSRDLAQHKGLDGYVLTPLVQGTLIQILEGLGGSVGDRAFTLTGTYGTGKSSFALYLYHLLSNSKGPAWEKLQQDNPTMVKEFYQKIFGSNKKGFIVLPVTSHRCSIIQLLAEALEHCPSELRIKCGKELDGLKPGVDTQTAVRLVERVAQQAIKSGYRGLFFIFDEFGKVFEKAYSDRTNTDIFLLQELAEVASRSGDVPIFLLGMLHQSFDSYVEDIQDTKTRNEFDKIAGRFRDLVFLEPIKDQLLLISRAIKYKKPLPCPIAECIDKMADDAIKYQLHLHAGLPEKDFRECVKKSWPIHPVALIALPMIAQSFGQNERSIFTFLSGSMPVGFREFIESQSVDKWLEVDYFFDYLMTNMETQLSRSNLGKTYLEANDVLHSKSLPLGKERLVKAVTVLSSMGKKCHLKASKDILGFALSQKSISDEIHSLVTQSILIYRRFQDSYAIWEGSDVDLSEREQQASLALSRGGFSLSQTLMESLPPRPFIAKRHSFKTGALRYFQVSYVDSPDELDRVLDAKKVQGTISGRILLCLAQSDAVSDTYKQKALEYSREKENILFAIPGSMGQLRDALYEVERLRWIVNNTEELRDDRIALREIGLRQAEALQRVSQLQQSLFDPRPAPKGAACCWIWKGQEQDIFAPRDVSILLSKACDYIYYQTPHILNEMINKNIISAQAAGARNNIIKALINPACVAQANLGIEGFPPDRSIYECLLLNSKLHTQVNGQWQLVAPVQNQQVNLYPAWQLMEQLVFAATEQPITLKELYEKLSCSPYGVTEGVLPILLTAFFVINRREVTLYQEGTFLPEPQEAHFELMVRRPDLFAIAGARITGLRKRIVDRLANSLKIDGSVSGIVRYLYRMFNSLPKYAKTTNQVDMRVAAFRKAFEEAKSPERLLFIDIPKALGLPKVSEEDSDDYNFEKYFELLNRALGVLASLLPNLIREQRSILLKVCQLPPTPEGWTELYDRAVFLAPKTNNTELLPFLQNVINTMGDWSKADVVMAYMVSVPMSNWSPLDIKNFPGIAQGKAFLLQKAWAPYCDENCNGAR